MHKKILFISDHGDPLASLGSEQAGGQNNYVNQLALALEEKGNRVDVVTHWVNPYEPQTETFGNFCRVIRIAAGCKTYVPKNEMLAILPNFYDEMRKTINIASYDLVHSHYWLSGLLGLFIKEDYHLPWIHTNHSLGIAKESATGIAEPARLSAERQILSSTDSIVATTADEKSLIRSFVRNHAPITVIPIGTDNQFQPFIEKGEEASHPYFAFAGRLEKTKGIYTLVNAFRRLVEKQDIPPSTKLIIAGGDPGNVNSFKKMPKKDKLKTAIVGLENRVDFIGAQSQHQLASLFNNAVATIVPSYYESFGMVAAEAQACGSPVIASKVGGLKDVVKNGTTGLHIEKGNERSLAHAMKTLLSNPHFADQLGKKAATFASTEFKWPVLAKRMVLLYEVVMNEQKNYMLATDLDGTLVGDKEALHVLLRYFDDSIYDVALVYITGRHLASALSLIHTEELPMPDVLISDVGTVIYTTNCLVEDEEWKKKMLTDWQPNLIVELASSIPALSRQPLPNNRRISFTIQSDEAVVSQLKKALTRDNVAHKLIFSSNRDVDILPESSGKGEALAYVLDKYACLDVNVLVAGDSGNDFEMLSLGYPSVIVGNAQPELASMEPIPQLYRATKDFAGGIYEAWIHFYE